MVAIRVAVDAAVYHTDSVESTSKLVADEAAAKRLYTILTLWSQLQNDGGILRSHVTLYHTDSVESTSKCMLLLAQMRRRIYHTDSVESTSKYFVLRHRRRHRYTILTLWSQLQNNDASMYDVRCTIPY